MDTPTHEITKNKNEVIRINRDEFKGADLINLRVFYDAGGGEFHPSWKGVAFRAALLPGVLKALKSLQMEGTS